MDCTCIKALNLLSVLWSCQCGEKLLTNYCVCQQKIKKQTRIHSSRMRTARLMTVCLLVHTSGCILPAGAAYFWWRGCIHLQTRWMHPSFGCTSWMHPPPDTTSQMHSPGCRLVRCTISMHPLDLQRSMDIPPAHCT